MGCPENDKRSSVEDARETSVGLVWIVVIDDIVKRSQQSRCRIEQVRNEQQRPTPDLDGARFSRRLAARKLLLQVYRVQALACVFARGAT